MQPETPTTELDSKARPAFRAVGLTKIYGEGQSAVRALRGVDLEIGEGEFIVLLGPSGSGKSTLLNIIGGLDNATEGRIFFRDQDITALDARRLTAFRRAHIGYIFQFYNLIASLTARENVALVTEIARDPIPPEEALTLVGLGDRLDHFPAQMSGGEQQRVAVARAVAKRPDVLLCDEPTGALDSATGIAVLEAIEQVNRELQATVIVITHNQAIGAIAERVISFADGKIAGDRRNQARITSAELSW